MNAIGWPGRRLARAAVLLALAALPTAARAQQDLAIPPSVLDDARRWRATGGPMPASLAPYAAQLGIVERAQPPVPEPAGVGMDSAARALAPQPPAQGPATSAARDATDPLPVFGRSLFSGKGGPFVPVLAGAPTDDYRIGPGDVLVLTLSGTSNASHTLAVTREGTVIVPQFGPMAVGQQSLGVVRALLLAQYRRLYGDVGTAPNARTRLGLTVASVRNVQVFVTGEVQAPGAYQVSALGTPLTALYAAQGPSARGSLRAVELRRGGQVVATIDLYAYMTQGPEPAPVNLEPGDVVFVPPHGTLVAVTGEVARPAYYEVRPDETLRELLRTAGGLRAGALWRAQVTRVRSPGLPGPVERVSFEVDAAAFVDGVAPAVPILPGDSVALFAMPDAPRRLATLVGRVRVPGEVGLGERTTVAQAIALAGGLEPDAFTGEVLVTRRHPDGTHTQERAAIVDSLGRTRPELVLDDGAVVKVVGSRAFAIVPTVSIAGAVHKPLELPYREGMTLRDLVLEAEGFTPNAVLDTAEIARIVPVGGSDMEQARVLRVPVDPLWAPGERPAASPQYDQVLQPYDHVLIRANGLWVAPRTVSVSGKVRFPGAYALSTDQDRVLDLLARAGGMLPTGALQGLTIRRRHATNRPEAPVEYVTVAADFSDLQRRGASSPANLRLEHGDSVIVADRDRPISIQGAVNRGTLVAVMPGADIDDYVKLAGGYSARADKKRAYVVQPDGRALHRDASGAVPMAGATIVVPERAPREPSPALQLLGPIIQIVGTLATTAALILR